jgi:Prealbumin-like fold domain
MTLHRRHRRARSKWAILIGVVTIGSILGATAALAAHPMVSLSGSNFEIDTNANLKQDHTAPSIDWASVTETRKQDTASGGGDESFGQGTKEDTAIPSVVDGGIPPNKSDLKFFGVYQEGGTSTGFLNLFWSRVQDPTGTTNMDFEFNQSTTISSNGVTPIRTAGDLLIIYDLSNGGTVPTLSKRTWTGSAWGPVTALVGGTNATGSINTGAIAAADADGLGAHSARTFGEAQLRLSAIFPNSSVCTSFGYAYLKSRSSDSFTAALKDFVPPERVNISNCGSVKIIKTDDAGTRLQGAEFTLYQDLAPIGTSRNAGGVTDPITNPVKKCSTAANGECTITGVLSGAYWVVESVTPAGHTSAADQATTVSADSTVTLTFVNPRQQGSIKITKTAKHAVGSPNLAANFSIKLDGTEVATATTNATTGVACVSGLLLDTYTVEETSGQAGYELDPDVETAIVAGAATCTGAPSASVTFENKPLTDITVSVNSQVTGGTISSITCGALAPDGGDATPNAFDDTSETYSDLVEGTYTCTIVVDP